MGFGEFALLYVAVFGIMSLSLWIGTDSKKPITLRQNAAISAVSAALCFIPSFGVLLAGCAIVAMLYYLTEQDNLQLCFVTAAVAICVARLCFIGLASYMAQH